MHSIWSFPDLFVKLCLSLILCLSVGLVGLQRLHESDIHGYSHNLSTILPELPDLFVSPAADLKSAYQKMQAQDLEGAETTIWRALHKAPFLSTAWMLLGYSIEQAAGITSALPYYDHAVQIDPLGKTMAEFTVPKLYAAKWVTVHQLSWWAARLGSIPLALQLPRQPPSDWPLEENRVVSRRAVGIWLAAGLDHWVIAEAEMSPMTERSPMDQSILLTSLCRSHHKNCLPLARACEEYKSPCEQGAAEREETIFYISQTALNNNQPDMALSWARKALGLQATARTMTQLVKVLEQTGNREEARRLKRLHPALQDYRK